MPPPYKMTAESSLKKYSKLHNYSANAYTKISFIKHLAAKFSISEYELKEAVRKNKVRIYVTM